MQMKATIDELGHVPVDTLSEQAQNDLVSAFRTFHAPSSDGDLSSRHATARRSSSS